MWHVYIIKSLNKKWYYVGSTNRLETRLSEHNSKFVLSTKGHTPFELVYTKAFEAEIDARKYERLIKDQRILKESLIKKIENR